MKQEAREFGMETPGLTWDMMKDMARGYAETTKDRLLIPFSYARNLREKLLVTLVPVAAGSAVYLAAGRPKLAIFLAILTWAIEGVVIQTAHPQLPDELPQAES